MSADQFVGVFLLVVGVVCYLLVDAYGYLGRRLREQSAARRGVQGGLRSPARRGAHRVGGGSPASGPVVERARTGAQPGLQNRGPAGSTPAARARGRRDFAVGTVLVVVLLALLAVGKVAGDRVARPVSVCEPTSPPSTVAPWECEQEAGE